MSDDKDSTRSGVVEGNVIANVVGDGDCDCRTCEDEEKDLSDDFFDASGGAVIGNRFSLRAVSESGSGTEADPSVP